MSIGARFRQIRLRHGLSQEAFGALCDVTKGAVSMWESDTTIPDTATIMRLKSSLPGFSFDWILFGEPYPPESLSQPVQNLMKVAEKLNDEAVAYLARQGDSLAEFIDEKKK